MLTDLLCKHLKLVICGTAAGNTSAQLKQYYAKPGNKFWRVLYEVGLTPIRLQPSQYANLLTYGIGLTDLAKNKSGMDKVLGKNDFNRQDLQHKIEQYQPAILCFNGKRAAEEFLQRPVVFGEQSERIVSTMLFVAPSTSGAANGVWDIKVWQKLAHLILSSR